jgi:hypothetical protein
MAAEEDQPESRKPTLDIQTHKPRTEEPVPVEIVAQPGDIFCRYCGTPNDPSRTFCRKCGKPLAAATTAPPPSVPWWRRLFGSKPKAALAAGDRPKHLGQGGQPRPGLIRRIAPVFIVAILAFGLTSLVLVPGVRDSIGDLVTDLRLRFLGELEPIIAESVGGTGVQGTAGAMAANNIRTDFWLAASDQDGGTPTITVRFEEAFYLGAILVHNGWSKDDDFTEHRRPKTLELSFPDMDIDPIRVELKDDPAEQSFYIDAKDVDTIVVKVIDTYTAGADEIVGLREIEFKKKQ